METFEDFWKSAFGETPPLGYILRRDLKHRWIRFHALPESKRYADTAAETQIILKRGNTLGTEVLGQGSECWLVVWKAFWHDFARQGKGLLDEESIIVRHSLEEAFDRLDPIGDPEDPIPMTFFAKRIRWHPGDFDDVLLSVAEDCERALFVATETGHVFAPYDGGFDLITEGSATVARLKTRFGDWMSDRSDWL